jgi:hypothetical protein
MMANLCELTYENCGLIFTLAGMMPSETVADGVRIEVLVK